MLELSAIFFFGIMLLLYGLQLGSRSQGRISSALDIVMQVFVVWAVAVYLIYFDKSQVRDLLKFVLPYFTYLLIRNSIRNREQFVRLLLWMLIGFSVPVVVTTVLVATNKGLEVENYWTGIMRFKGAYQNSHDMGHNMTFLIMTVVLFWVMRKEQASAIADDVKLFLRQRRWNVQINLFLTVLVVLALYCLYKSVVRTAYLGLALFGFWCLYFYNKKWLIISFATVTAAIVLMWSVWSLIFYDVLEVYQGKKSADHFGSGRPQIWDHNWKIFSGMTFDRQLAGVGIGNRVGMGEKHMLKDNIWNSHNDILEVMIQTGYIGFLLYIIMQMLIFRAILKMQGREKYVFISLFFAVTFMNFSSNSYVSRFGLGQELYMILAYIQVAPLVKSSLKISPEIRTV